MMNIGKRDAMVLVVVTGVLMVLSTLGVCFTRVSYTERSAAANYVDTFRATLTAEAGFWRGVKELRALTLTKSLCYPGDEWVYQGTKRGTIGAGTPIEESSYPSYWWIGDQITLPHQPKPEPQPVYNRVISGIVSNSYEHQGDTYTLKILETSSQLNLNIKFYPFNLDPSTDPLGSILNYLGDAVEFYQGVNPLKINGSYKGHEIVELRQDLGGRFNSKESVSSLIGERNFSLIRDYITVTSWIDSNTVARDSLQGSGYWVPEPRPPININLAPKPVLVAVLAGLSNGTSTVSFEQAIGVAEVIDAYRQVSQEDAFYSWEHFYYFIGLLSSPVVNDNTPSENFLNYVFNSHPTSVEILNYAKDNRFLSPILAEIIKANANPNMSTRRFNPDKTIYQPVDKTDLTYHTTEFGFISNGYYEILSLGMVTDNGGRIRSQKLLSSITKIHNIIQHTTQCDFQEASLSSEGGLRSLIDIDTSSDRNTTSYFNHYRHNGVNGMGYVQVQPQEYFPINNPLRDMHLIFDANYTTGLSASTRRGGDAHAYGGKTESLPLSQGGDLSRDGVLIRKGESPFLAYDSTGNLPIQTGTLTFWLKYNDLSETNLTTILFSDSPIQIRRFPQYSNKSGIQMMIQASLVNGNIRLIASRLFYVKPVPALTERDRVELSSYCYLSGYYSQRKYSVETEITGNVNPEDGLYLPHKWYHIAIAWDNGTNFTLYVDGKRAGIPVADSGTPTDSPLTGLGPYDPRIYIGRDPLNPPGKDITIDDVQIYDMKIDLAIDPKPLQYERRSPYRYQDMVERREPTSNFQTISMFGVFKGKFVLPSMALIGPVTWTAIYPNPREREIEDFQDLINVRLELKDQILSNLKEKVGVLINGVPQFLGDSLQSASPTREIDYSVHFLYIDDTPLESRKVSSVLDDITLSYQGNLEILSYNFIGE